MAKIKKILIIAIVICFTVLSLAGILKFHELLKPFNIPYNNLPMSQISVLHDWAGLTLIFLILIHLIVQRSWFTGQFKKNKKGSTKILFLILIGIGTFLLASFLINKYLFQQPESIKKLESIEIKDYQGENLSSISDFRENSIKGPQNIDIKNYVLNIDGLVDKKLSLTYDQVLNHNQYTKIVTLNCVEGWSAKILWQGVLIKDLLTEAGIKPGSNTVIFYAVDGYSSSLSLDYVTNNNITLAYKINGVVIPPERGFPFQVVAEDKWGYKWVKWVTKIEVSNDPNYKGYWENAGYNQNGDLKGSKYEN
ncbi:MAG: molybdopterin-dependent oxidoreductase [Candidatus Shapirobacteria bacterium]|jgi:hypothetical protein